MFKTLVLRNFKSFERAEFPLRRVNVLIGPPNSGKSNVLDALMLLSPYGEFEYLRIDSPIDLIYQQDGEREVEIALDDLTVIGKFEGESVIFRVKEEYPLSVSKGSLNRRLLFPELACVKVYRFWGDEFERSDSGFLLPPDGKNLLGVLLSNAEVRRELGALFKSFGLKLVIAGRERLEVQWEKEEGFAVALRFKTVSDGLKRLALHLAAILSNKDSLICFEEPESHTFPFYAKLLARAIADDESNQYIITTHNPYFLLTLMEKTPKSDLAVFLLTMKDYRSDVKMLSEDEVSELVDRGIDIFLNIEEFA